MDLLVPTFVHRQVSPLKGIEMGAASTKDYVKTWAWLLVLLVISILGPELGIKSVTLITAFGIAIVKAYIVANKFMHLNIERKYISYMLIAMLLMVILFFYGVAPDVMLAAQKQKIHVHAKRVIRQHVGTGGLGRVFQDCRSQPLFVQLSAACCYRLYLTLIRGCESRRSVARLHRRSVTIVSRYRHS